jgi:hypothetical protein
MKVEEEQEGKGLLVGSVFQEKTGRAPQQKILNHMRLRTKRFPIHTEEARCGTDRMGVADVR